MKYVQCWINVWLEYNYIVLWANLYFHILDLPKVSYLYTVIVMKKMQIVWNIPSVPFVYLS